MKDSECTKAFEAYMQTCAEDQKTCEKGLKSYEEISQEIYLMTLCVICIV